MYSASVRLATGLFEHLPLTQIINQNCSWGDFFQTPQEAAAETSLSIFGGSARPAWVPRPVMVEPLCPALAYMV